MFVLIDHLWREVPGCIVGTDLNEASRVNVRLSLALSTRGLTPMNVNRVVNPESLTHELETEAELTCAKGECWSAQTETVLTVSGKRSCT